MKLTNCNFIRRGSVMAERSGRRIVVIGGGLAGLASAVWLAEAGDQVTLLERRGRLGGRTLGFPLDAAGGEMVDNGQHVIAGSYTNIFRYLDSVGTREFVRFPDQWGVRAPDGTAGSLGIRARDQLKVLAGKAPGISVRDVFKSIPAQAKLFAASRRPAGELDQITVDEWLDRVGMPASVRRVLWHPVTIGVLNELPHLASAHALASAIQTGMRNTRKYRRRAMSIGWPTVDLHTLYLAGAEKAFAKHGVDVRLRAKATRIEVTEQQVRGMTDRQVRGMTDRQVPGVTDQHVPGMTGRRVHGVRMADGGLIEADAVVMAVPAWDVGGLLDDVPGAEPIVAATRELVPIPIMSVNLYLDRPIGTEHPWETLLDTDVHWVFDRTLMHGRRSEAGWLYALTTCASYDLIELRRPEVVERCMASLRSVYPEAREANVVHAHVVPWRRATFSSRPGTGTIRPGQRTEVEGLALAGDWTRNDWPTTMEGAAQSAARAVEVLRDVRPRSAAGSSGR
ncbi:hydroxysqualene dehydroxylase HpnE [Actinomadura rudentiformis]|uniref:FAD-dependent oxidoreductase n=1 Tax=Actinomadura rudentiformis TaxID=359158 RepID=A0A6H9YLN3_9ACTN|nr:hydroxysqualene dehydroxylase HpnE [Actinomadura rudentiformis]KAB2348270.1 FAD-dependent oxidoreductase [Actinomadura rudentiformis]